MPVVASHVKESAVVAAPVETVWRTIKALDFQWWKLVASATPKDGAPLSLGSTYKLAFKDGQQWTIALMEASEINRSITFEVLESEPAIPVTSVVHTISLQRISATNQTFVMWDTDFSNDATSEVILDSKYKKLEAFGDLAASCQ